MVQATSQCLRMPQLHTKPPSGLRAIRQARQEPLPIWSLQLGQLACSTTVMVPACGSQLCRWQPQQQMQQQSRQTPVLVLHSQPLRLLHQWRHHRLRVSAPSHPCQVGTPSMHCMLTSAFLSRIRLSSVVNCHLAPTVCTTCYRAMSCRVTTPSGYIYALHRRQHVGGAGLRAVASVSGPTPGHTWHAPQPQQQRRQEWQAP